VRLSARRTGATLANAETRQPAPTVGKSHFWRVCTDLTRLILKASLSARTRSSLTTPSLARSLSSNAVLFRRVTSRVFVATPSSAPSSARVVASAAPLRRSFAATSGAASLELVKQLRARTQAGILNCKKALEVSRTALVLCPPSSSPSSNCHPSNRALCSF
jgi:hypothetical protein